MKEIWARFEEWLDKNANQLLDDLNDAAEDSDFEPIERQMGAELPSDFKAFYKIHNGQYEESEDRLYGVDELLSTERMLEERNKLKEKFYQGEFDDLESEPDAFIRDEWYNPYWLPLTSDGTGNYICMDFAPTKEGNIGQIIKISLTTPKRKKIYSDFKSWIETYVLELEKGFYQYSPKWGGMLPKSKSRYEHEESIVEDDEEDIFGDEENEGMEGFEILDESDFS